MKVLQYGMAVFAICLFNSCVTEQIIERDKTVVLRRAPQVNHLEMGIPLSLGMVRISGGYQNTVSNTDAVIYRDTTIVEGTYLLKKTITSTHYYESSHLAYGDFSIGLTSHMTGGIGVLCSFGNVQIPSEYNSPKFQENLIQTSAYFRLIVPLDNFDVGVRIGGSMMILKGREYYNAVEGDIWEGSTEYHEPNTRISLFGRYEYSPRVSGVIGVQYQTLTIIPEKSYEDTYSIYSAINYRNSDQSILSPYVSMGFRGKQSDSSPVLNLGVTLSLQSN
jgi:hypothetical protein